MQLTLTNEIQLDQEMEVIHQAFEVTVQEKNGWLYLMYQNDEAEKVVMKCHETELVTTRFSEPKTVMRFVKGQEAIVVLPTPMGVQHFETVTHTYHLDKVNQTLKLSYDLRPLGSDQLFASYQMTIRWA